MKVIRYLRPSPNNELRRRAPTTRDLVPSSSPWALVKFRGLRAFCLCFAPASEYPALLAAAFRRSDLPKPLDEAGKPKELPLADMENLLVAYINVDEESMRELAQQRGLAVRDYLASRQLPLDRLFLGPVKLAGSEASWTPRAELTLATP